METSSRWARWVLDVRSKQACASELSMVEPIHLDGTNREVVWCHCRFSLAIDIRIQTTAFLWVRHPLCLCRAMRKRTVDWWGLSWVNSPPAMWGLLGFIRVNFSSSIIVDAEVIVNWWFIDGRLPLVVDHSTGDLGNQGNAWKTSPLQHVRFAAKQCLILVDDTGWEFSIFQFPRP